MPYSITYPVYPATKNSGIKNSIYKLSGDYKYIKEENITDNDCEILSGFSNVS